MQNTSLFVFYFLIFLKWTTPTYRSGSSSLRRGYNVDVGVVEYNQTEDNKKKRIQLEVDFVVNRANIRYDIQSALALSSEEKREQEINSLKRIDDSFKKIVVVKDDIIPRYDEQGIYYIGVKDFLLTDSIFEN